MIFQIFFAFVGTFAFAVLFNAPRNQLLYCGLVGALGWFAYLTVANITASPLYAAFFGSFIITMTSRILATIKKIPVTIYLISGIIPFVPGSGMFYTMSEIVNNNYSQAALQGFQTIKAAGAIATAILIALSLPIGKRPCRPSK